MSSCVGDAYRDLFMLLPKRQTFHNIARYMSYVVGGNFKYGESAIHSGASTLSLN
jgi:hypothetical protein